MLAVTVVERGWLGVDVRCHSCREGVVWGGRWLSQLQRGCGVDVGCHSCREGWLGVGVGCHSYREGVGWMLAVTVTETGWGGCWLSQLQREGGLGWMLAVTVTERGWLWVDVGCHNSRDLYPKHSGYNSTFATNGSTNSFGAFVLFFPVTCP